MNNDEEKKKCFILEQIENDIPNHSEFSDKELEILEEYSNDENENIRALVAKILINFTNSRGENILIKLTKDSDDLVRTEACDSLSESHSLATQKLLKDIADNDSDIMVRGYAISSIGKIASRIQPSTGLIEYLENYYKKEKEIFIQINLLTVLYSLGKSEYLDKLIKLLDTDIYQNRCAVVNSLEEVIKEDNKELIKRVLIKQRNKEKIYAVTSTIDEILKNLEE